jgi:type I restriction enzyme S subunit
MPTRQKGWQTKKLGEICDIERGGSPRPIQEFITTDPNGINWIKIGDATASGKYIYKTEEKIKPEGVKRSRMVYEGDFILSNSMSFGRPYIMKTTGCIHDGWLVLHKPKVDPDYLYHALSSDLVFDQFDRLAAGSTVRNLNIGLAKSVEIPYPPLDEQRRIVALLDEAFDGIATAKANAEQNLQNARALFESHLNSVFAQKGKGWVEKTLESCCEQIFAGGDVPKDRLSKERTPKFSVPIYSNGEKNDGLYGFTDVARVTKPSITVSARGTLGFTAIRTEPFLPVVRLIVLVPDEKQIGLSFLYYAVVGMDFGNTGTSIPQLTVPNFKELKLHVPPVSQQEAIVAQLDALSAETRRLAAIYEQKLAALEGLKKSLLNRAFNGEL